MNVCARGWRMCRFSPSRGAPYAPLGKNFSDAFRLDADDVIGRTSWRVPGAMTFRAEQVFFEVFEPLPRQGPGNLACAERALALCAELRMSPRVLDLGCG